VRVVSNPFVVTQDPLEVDFGLLERVLRLAERLDHYLSLAGRDADRLKVRRSVVEMADLLLDSVGEPPRHDGAPGPGQGAHDPG
jgi:hypothetical protein